VANEAARLLLAAALPLALGGTSMVVRSGSMTPAIRTGDVVVVRPIAPTEAEVGDIVTFKDPAGSDRLLVHRVRAISRSGDQVEVITKGDANTTQEQWKVAANGTIGTVAYRVPTLGFAIGWIGSPAGRIGLVIVPSLLLAAMLLMRIWRPRVDPEGA
jgi:signal peptidase